MQPVTNFRTDTLGYRIVMYWPHIEIDSQYLKGEPEEEYDDNEYEENE